MLKKFPTEYIYEPWKAPSSVQQAAGCIVGKDYPRPIVEHEVISKKNIQRMKTSYAKRSQGGPESPQPKKGKYIDYAYLGMVRVLYFQICLKSLINKYGFVCFCCVGEKRKAPSVVDMLKNKKKS